MARATWSNLNTLGAAPDGGAERLPSAKRDRGRLPGVPQVFAAASGSWDAGRRLGRVRPRAAGAQGQPGDGGAHAPKRGGWGRGWGTLRGGARLPPVAGVAALFGLQGVPGGGPAVAAGHVP